MVAANRRGNAFISSEKDLMGKHFDELFDNNIEKLIQHLATGEVLRVRDNVGSAVSIRCVANKAAFALARMSLSGAELPKAPSRVRVKNHFRDVVIGDKALGAQLSKISSVLHENPVIHIRGDVGTVNL